MSSVGKGINYTNDHGATSAIRGEGCADEIFKNRP